MRVMRQAFVLKYINLTLSNFNIQNKKQLGPQLVAKLQTREIQSINWSN